MDDVRRRYGPWALITGASSGIGEEFARQLAALGLNLVLVARRKRKLEELADHLANSYRVDVKIVVTDLSRPDFMEPIRSSTDGLDIGLLINNAGFTRTGELLGHSLESELDLLDVNCRAPLILAHEFGNRMKKRGMGGVVFVASTVAFNPVPLWTHYAASKAYVLFLAEGMAHELKDSGVHVMALCPGGTRTEFQHVAGISYRWGSMEVEQVVSLALRKLGKKTFVIPGWHNQLFYFISKWIPRRLMVWIAGKTMERLKQNDKGA